MAAVSAGVAARGGQQKDVDAFGRVFRERASHAQGFVIGVGEHGHQPRSVHATPLFVGTKHSRVCARRGVGMPLPYPEDFVRAMTKRPICVAARLQVTGAGHERLRSL